MASKDMFSTSTDIKKPRLPAKFNIVDILIILLVVAGIVLLLFRLGAFGTVNAVDTAAVVSFVIGDESGIRDTTAAYFNAGDEVYLTSSVGAGVSPVGKIVSVGVSPHREERLINNEAVTFTYPSDPPTKVEVSGTIRFSGTYADGGFYIGGKQYAAAGSQIYLCTDKVDFYITVISVEVDG